MDKFILSLLTLEYTGGGCMALVGNHPDGGYIVATDYNGCSLPKHDNWLLCYYESKQAHDDGEQPLIVESHELH